VSAPNKTLAAAMISGTAAAVFVARHYKLGTASSTSDANVLQDVLLTFGVLVVAGVALGGVKEPDSIGRGLLWGAGGLAATYGIDKALVKGR
jgi:hypothetical protein